MTLVLFIFTFIPLFSTLFFHSLSLLLKSYSVSAITTKSSAYNSSKGKATLNSLDMASMTITNNSELNAEPWCITNCSDSCFCTCVHRHDCQYQPFFHCQLMHCPPYHFSLSPIKSFFQIHKAKVELLSFNSKILMQMASVVPLPFINTNCISSTLNLLPNSVLKDPFHYFRSVFQQFNPPIRSTLHWITFPFVNG